MVMTMKISSSCVLERAVEEVEITKIPVPTADGVRKLSIWFFD